MTIENSLERIATALEALAAKRDVNVQPVSVSAPSAPDAPAAPSAPDAPAAPSAPDAPAAMTPQQLNEVMVGEFKRLGGREPIDKVLHDHGVQSISDLDPSQYQSVITAVQAL